MRVTQLQHEERIQAILAQDHLRASDASRPTTHATNRLKQSRRSNAARVFLGAEDQTAYDCTHRPQPDQAAATTHFAPRLDIVNPLTTPRGAHLTAGPGTSKGLRPRRFTSAKPSDIGLYEPDKGSDIFSWWRGVVQYQAYSGATEAEVFSGLPDCFSKWPRQWLDELIPRPATLKEFRNRAFQAFMRDATLVQDDVDHRKFKPQEESLETYLFDKYKLVSELQVSKAMAAGHTDFDNPNPESARILMTIKDAIQTVHNGLPADWRTLLNVYRQEEDWPAYRSQLLGNEQQTREAIAVFSGNSQSNQSGQAKQNNPPIVKHNTGWKPEHIARSYGQPTLTNSDSSARKKDREKSLCYHCHEPGYFKHKCPQREEDIRRVRSVLATMEDMDHRNEDPPVVRQVQMTLENGPRSAGSGVNNVTRVIHAKRVRVSKYEDESEPQRVVCARATKISMEDDSPALSPLEWERGGPTMADAYYTEDNSDRGSASDY